MLISMARILNIIIFPLYQRNEKEKKNADLLMIEEIICPKLHHFKEILEYLNCVII